ncbi:hypothetical protein RHMOL_Rhmol03G0236200 [Rhododendron molle]|uniref:Uncharacterized protein n=1 Tax=Rhododendron molle TaxID=49168 RepID=A0ACC0PHR7_RHOML|nr:hypothetical protein RHMOL_Rhmol03G0236200 [Rhododendron molle]
MQQPTKTAGPSTPNTMTTEEIQKYLDENKRLICAIMENNNLGRTTESTQYQAQLQQNLIFLAAIADAQPQAPTMTSQTPLQSVVQQEHHIQQPQPEMVQQQPSALTPNFPFQLNALQSQDQQHHQLLQQHHMGMIPGANTSMQQAMQLGIGNSGFLGDARSGSRQDFFETGSGGSQGGNSASGRLIGERDSHL